MAAALLASIAVAADDDPADIPDEGIDATITGADFGGAAPLATSRTVRHWSSETTNGVNGVTYQYNMVGADPSTDGSAVIGVDIIPVDVTVGGREFKGSQITNAVLASPLFSTSFTVQTSTGPVTLPYSYATTAAASNALGGPGVGGSLSPGNSGVQLLDATMRAQFNKIASPFYHLVLDPAVHDPVAIDVPDDKGTIVTSPVGVTMANLDMKWFRTRVQNQLGRLNYLDPTRLALFLTYDVLVTTDGTLATVVVGAHGAGPATGNGNGNVLANGNQPVQTFVWGSWLSTGFFSRNRMWAIQDIHSLSHEIVSWAVDPFVTNTVQPWFVARSSQYGCSDLMETADPVAGLGFAVGAHNFDINRFSEHRYHPSDQAFLPWFMRSDPQTQSKQHDPSVGRFTFLGDLNQVKDATGNRIFQQAATGC